MLFRKAALAVLALACAQAAAQSVPGAVLPGRVEQDSKRAPLPAPRQEVIRLERSRFAEQAPPGAAQTRLLLASVTLHGNSVLGTAELAPLWAPLLGREISLDQVFALAARISAAYRARGYVLSQAIVPQQDMRADGAALRIEILEGYIAQVTYAGIAPARVDGYFAPVLAEKPLRLATLERSLLLVNELGGVNAQANLKAGTVPNASDLALVVAPTPGVLSLSVHNRSTPAQGRARYEASAELYDRLGLFERHSLRLIGSGDERLKLFAYGLEAPLGSSGLKFQLNASVSRSQPTSVLGNIDTRSNNLAFTLSYPLVRSRQTNVALRAALSGANNSSDSALTSAASEDHLRALRLGVGADYADDVGGISMADAEWSKGLDRFGATEASPGYLPNPTFGKLALYAARLQHLRADWSLLFAASGQYSDDALATAEQLGLGGDTFLRAYDPSEAIGEKGYAAKVELRYNFQLGAAQSTAYAYADRGAVRRKQAAGPDLRFPLSAAGVGLRFSGPARIKGYLEVAKPLHRIVASEGNKKARLFGGLGIDF
jgi:hemolysin activation/secretion protein